MIAGKPDMVRTSKLHTISAPRDGQQGDAGKFNFASSAQVPIDIYRTITRYNGDKNDLANLVNLPDQNRFDLDLANWAPKDWDGDAWVIFNATNPTSGSATVRGHLDVPGLRVARK